MRTSTPTAAPVDDLDQFRGLPSVHDLADALERAGLTVDDHALSEAIGRMGAQSVATVLVSANPWRSAYQHDVEVTLHWADHHCVRLGYTLSQVPAHQTTD